MTSKQKTALRIEYEIEKGREESNWKKVHELAEQLAQKNSGFESLVNFLVGESKLEQYLEEHPPIDANIQRARTGLTDAKRYLQACLDGGNKVDFMMDVCLLLAKLLYAQGFYEEALNTLTKSGLDGLTKRQLSSRLMKVVAESFAIKGLCLEKVPPETSSRYRAAERDNQIVTNLIKAGDLGLRYLQELERTQGGTGGTLPVGTTLTAAPGAPSPLPPNTEYRIGPILETALQRSPILFIKSGQLQKAVEQYRRMLNAVETSSTQSLRQILSRQLAEVLLRGVCSKSYPEYASNSEKSSDFWKPKKYSGNSLFVPKELNEEILLLLFISETMAVRNAVLDRAPEFAEARLHSYHTVTAVYDLLTIALSRLGLFTILFETYDRAMKFAFEEYHIWFQFALSLIGSGKYHRAFLVLKECAGMEGGHNDPLPCLMAARLCYEHLGMAEQGLECAKKALSRELVHPQGYLARCHLAVGLGLHLSAHQAREACKRQELRAQAFHSFQKAQNADPNDHLSEFYIALHYAQARQLSEGVLHAKTALSLYPEHAPSLHLLVLLLSAQKSHEEALQLLEVTVDQYPHNLSLLYTKAHLEEQCRGGEAALLTCRQMLHQWKKLYDSTNSLNPRGGSIEIPTIETGMRRVASDSRSIFQLYTTDLSDNDSGGNSGIAVARIEQALSEVASSLSGLHSAGATRAHSAWILHIWLLTAELYLKMGKVGDAEACLREAALLFPLSHHLMLMRGLIHEYKEEYEDAKVCFQNAIAVNPVHVKALQHLGMVYHYLGSSQLGEKTLREAVTADPMCHQAWYNMGRVLQDLGRHEAAARCLTTALDLEATAPVLPFAFVSRTLD